MNYYSDTLQLRRMHLHHYMKRLPYPVFVQGSLMTGLKLPNLAGRGERLQADYTYGTKKSSSFNISLLKPLRGLLKSNLSGEQPLKIAVNKRPSENKRLLVFSSFSVTKEVFFYPKALQ